MVEERGIPDFTALRRAPGEGRGDKAVLLAFDLLFLDGEDLRGRPLVERKARRGDLMMRQAAALGLEGRGVETRRPPVRLGRDARLASGRLAPGRASRFARPVTLRQVEQSIRADAFTMMRIDG